MAVLWDYRNLLPRKEYHRYYLSDVPVSLPLFSSPRSTSGSSDWLHYVGLPSATEASQKNFLSHGYWRCSWISRWIQWGIGADSTTTFWQLWSSSVGSASGCRSRRTASGRNGHPPAICNPLAVCANPTALPSVTSCVKSCRWVQSGK